MGITVGMVTKDSAERLGNSFTLVLRKLKKEVPFEKFILVDSSKSDKTSKIASEEVNANIFKVNCNRAVARQIVIDNTSSEWLLFIDDDVLLEDGWFKPANELMKDSSVGLIWGPMKGREGTIVKHQEVVRMFLQNGSTTDTLIRMDAIKGIKIPPFLHWREDTYIRNFVLSRGYRCVVSPVGMFHLKGRRQILEDNSKVDVKLKWFCEKYVGTYRPNPKRAFASLFSIFIDPHSVKWRLEWFKYYSNLYTTRDDTPYPKGA